VGTAIYLEEYAPKHWLIQILQLNIANLAGVPSIVYGILGPYALGATRWQTIWHLVLPLALPGILTGTILALSRGIGETAPLLMIGALTFVAFTPASPLDPFTALPIQIFNWTGRPQDEFRGLAAAGIIVLLGILLLMNTGAVLLRNKFQRRDEG
jgi:phosphate transport system permease protein